MGLTTRKMCWRGRGGGGGWKGGWKGGSKEIMVILMALMLFCGTIIKQEKVFYEINIAQRVHEPDNKTCIPSNAKIHTVGELGRTKNRMEKPTVDISRMYMYIY